MASKVVPQGIQMQIKEAIGVTVHHNNPDFTWDADAQILSATGGYEVIMVVIPKQAMHHSEVRNG